MTQTMRTARVRPLAQTVGYYIAFIALGLVTASLGPTLPGLAAQTHANLRDVSYLFAARAFGYLLGSLVGGRWYDRLRGHPLMACVLVVIVLTLALVPLMPLLWLLVAVMLALGMGEGALDVGGNTLIVWVHGARVGPFLNGLHFFFGVGAFLSPIIIGPMLLLGGGLMGAYWTLALLLLPCIARLWRTPSPAAQTVSPDGRAGQVHHRLLALIVLFFFLYVGAEGGFGGWVFTYAMALRLSGEMVASLLTSTFWGALTLGRLLSIPIAARFQPRTILCVDLLGCLLSVGVILVGSNSLNITWVGTAGLGLCMASIFPTMLALAERRMTITGQVTGWFFVGASAGNMFWPWMIGQLFEAIGPRVMLVTIGVDLLLALGLFVMLNLYSNRAALRTT